MNTIPNKDERTWGMLCHLSAFAFFVIPFGNVLGPLIIWLIKKDQYPFVEDQGKEALNFQISFVIYAFISALLIVVLIGIVLLIVIFIIDFVFVIIAAIKANDGIPYRYPLTLKIIK